MTTSTEQLYSFFRSFPKVCTDSRNVQPGSIFFALSGPSFNGNAFAAAAIAAGCVYAVVDQPKFAQDERYLLVDDVLEALQDLALHHRRQLKTTIIAITGSNGKTTTKELIREVLSRKYRTVATHGNLNNHIGVPLTLLGITADAEMAVIEMGANKRGDIKELVDIAEPEFGLITNIGKAHLEGMGGYEGVVKTKTELYDFLRANGKTAFINTDHQVFNEKSNGIMTFTFGSDPANEVQGTFLSADPLVKFSWRSTTANQTLESVVETSLVGRYNFENMLAAAAIGAYFEVPVQLINEAISGYVPDNNRSQQVKTTHNNLILDAYNANPTSMEAAIGNFAEMKAPHKIVILGKMMELGETSIEEHIKIAELATTSGFDQVYLIGNYYHEAGITKARQVFDDVDTAINWFRSNPVANATVLIKGSRANKLERLQEVL